MVMDQKGLRPTSKGKASLDAIKSRMKVGDKVCFKKIEDDQIDFYDWLRRYWGLLIPLAQEHLDFLSDTHGYVEIASDIMKEMFCSMKAPELIKTFKSRSGREFATLPSLNATDGINKEYREKFDQFIQEVLAQRTGIAFYELAGKFIEDKNLKKGIDYE